MLLIYVDKLTNRVGYTMNIVFRVILHCEFAITTDRSAFEQHSGAKLCYSHEPCHEAVCIKPARLLFATSIEEQDTHFFLHQGQPALYPVYGQHLDLPYDPFAAIFFTITRYEEYLPFHRDAHGRFTATESLAYKEGYLQTAVVDRWALAIRDRIANRFSNFVFPTRCFEVEETVDIDAAYCYKHKGVFRTLIGMARDGIGNHNPDEVRHRLRVLCNKEEDPFDTFDYIIDLKHKHKGLKLIFFTLLGDYSQYDKPVSHNNSHFRQLLQHIGDHAKIGIHPSYGTMEEPRRIEIEAQRLEDILHRTIVRSRFHFLRLQLPVSYRQLAQSDIQHDYTMGYAEVLGFRAGTATPHPFYDLEWNCEGNLTVHPFVAMDTTLQKYMALSPESALHAYKKIIDETFAVGSTFNAIWHNQNLCEQFGWQGWRQVYEQTIDYACSLMNHGTTSHPLNT